MAGAGSGNRQYERNRQRCGLGHRLGQEQAGGAVVEVGGEQGFAAICEHAALLRKRAEIAEGVDSHDVSQVGCWPGGDVEIIAVASDESELAAMLPKPDAVFIGIGDAGDAARSTIEHQIAVVVELNKLKAIKDGTAGPRGSLAGAVSMCMPSESSNQTLFGRGFEE